MEKEKKILLVDMNAYFASIEQMSNPTLRGKPVVVGGPRGTRSVVAAASYEARKYGIKSAMSISEAVQKCPDLLIVSGDMDKYIDSSRKILKILMDYTDLVEVYSIDECFMDVTATEDYFGGAVEIAKQIKKRIRLQIGINCSVGIAPNKLLSKLAAGMQKPDGLTQIKPEQIKGILKNLPAGELHGIGRKLVVHLADMGIKTAGQLGDYPRELLKKRFGINGEIMHDMGNGIDHSKIIPYYDQPDNKSVGHSHTLDRNTRDAEVLGTVLLKLSEKVGRRLREQNFAGRTITLVVRYSDFHTFTRRKSLPDHIDDGYSIYMSATQILNEQYNDNRAIRLLGVSVSGLVKGSRQMQLFEDPKYRALMETVDKINDKFGDWTVRRARLLKQKRETVMVGFGGSKAVNA